jgi:IS30 family transposase
MVRDGKELSTDLKETIMGLDQEGYSACKISEFLSLNRGTVSYIIKRYREHAVLPQISAHFTLFTVSGEINTPQNYPGKCLHNY